MFTYLGIMYGYTHAKMAEMSNCDRDHQMVPEAKNIYYWPFLQRALN